VSRLTCGHIQHMYSWWWVRLSPETCRVKPLRRIKTQLLHLVGLISLLQELLTPCEISVPNSHAIIPGTYSGLTITCGRARNESNSFCRMTYSPLNSFPSSRNVPSWFRNNSITQMTIIVICVLSWGFRPSNFCKDKQ